MAKTALEQFDETAANNTDVGSNNIDEGNAPSTMNNAIRELMSQMAKWLGDDTLASAGTTDLGSVPGRYVNITGTTTITAFGTIKAGTVKYVKFAGALTLTHNASSLILPGSANITTVAGDTAIFASEGSGNWRCLVYQPTTPLVRDWELVSTSTPSAAAAVTQTGLSAYRRIRVSGYLLPATDGASLYLQTSEDNGETYNSGASDYDWQVSRATGSTASGSGDTADIGLIASVAGVGNASNEGVRFSVELDQFNKTTYCFSSGTALTVQTDGTLSAGALGGRRLSATARNAIAVLFSSGNIASGYVTIEGIRG